MTARGLLTDGPGALWAGLAVGLGGALLLVAFSARFAPEVALAVVAALAVGAVAILFEPRLAYLAMAFVVPLERLGRFGDDLELQTFSLMRLVGLVALAAMMAQVLVRRQTIEVPRALVLYGLMIAMAFASIGYADDPVATRSHAITMAGNFLMLFVLVQGMRDWGIMRAMVLAWLAATVAIGIYQIWGWHFGTSISDGTLGETETRLATTWLDVSEVSTLGEVRRAFGTTSSAAVYGINLLLALPFLFWGLRMARSGPGAVLWLAATGIVLYNIMLTNTRAVFLFCAVLLLAILVTGLYRLTLRGALGLGLALAVVLTQLPASIWNRVLNPEAYRLSNATNLSWRFELWEAALHLGAQNWLTGIGVGNRTAITRLLDPTRFEAGWIMAHNEYLQVFYELGLFGLGVFLAFLGVLSLQAWATAARLRARGEEDKRWFVVAAGLSLFIGMIFALQVDAFHFPLKGWWLAAGLVVVADRLSRAETPPPPRPAGPRGPLAHPRPHPHPGRPLMPAPRPAAPRPAGPQPPSAQTPSAQPPSEQPPSAQPPSAQPPSARTLSPQFLSPQSLPEVRP